MTNLFLNDLLSNFYLEVVEEIRQSDRVNFLNIRHTGNKKNISFENLSTGTKQIILSLIPLYFIDTKNSVILVDEPERSLFPDIQKILIKQYTNLAPEAQFFFATHSPIIASQFEPCERFILKFDKNGNIYAIPGNAPEGDDPNDLLIKDFGLDTVLTEKGLKMWEKFVEISRDIHFEKDEKKKRLLMDKYMEIGTMYNFGSYEKNQ